MIRAISYSILSLLVFFLLYLTTILQILFALLCAKLGMKRTVVFLIRLWAKSVFVILCHRLRVYGREHIDPNRKYILLANHASAFDISAIMSFYPGVSWFGREHLLKVPLFGQILKAAHYIPMKKAGPGQTRKMLENLVKNSTGLTIAIFPEGTRTTTGRINRFHKGFVHLIQASDLDVLPVTLNGFYLLKPKNRFWISFDNPISATIHPPIPNAELAGLDESEIIRRVRTQIVSAYTLSRRRRKTVRSN